MKKIVSSSSSTHLQTFFRAKIHKTFSNKACFVPHTYLIWCKKISFSKCVQNWYFIIVLTLLYGFAYVWKKIWLVSDLKVRFVLCKTIWCLFIRKVSKDFQTESTLIYFIKLQMKKLVKFFANFILQKTPNEIQILFFIIILWYRKCLVLHPFF